MKWLVKMFVASLLVASLLVACSGSSGDIVGPFTGPTHRFVVDRFSLPVTSADAKAIGDDLDGNGRVDNQLGATLAVLANDDNLTTHADDMIKSGALASIIEIQADDLHSDPTVGVRYFGRQGDPAIVVGGSIAGGIFTPNRTRDTQVPGRATLRLPVFADASPSVIVLDAMEIDLDPDDAGGYNARIRGAAGGDVTTETARGLIEMIDANPQGHPYATLLLDADHDGHVSTDEVMENSLIASLIKPDVRVLVDDDYVERLSFGFGVHLIPCATGNCALGTPAASCFDRVVDGDESDIDCGGSCMACPANAACSAASDCQSQSCSGTCAAPSCSDGVHDGYETDVDCGWNCGGCTSGRQCRRSQDCLSQRCGTFNGMTNVCY
jgi:hypothetical protein